MSTSTLIPATTLATEDQLWLFAELFRCEWGGGVEIQNEYRTNVSYSLSKSEQRYSLNSRPLKSQSITLQAGGRDYSSLQTAKRAPGREVSAMLSFAQRLSMAKSLWPLFSDESRTTATLSAAGTTVMCSTTNIRFFSGTRVVIVPTSDNHVDGPYYDDAYPLHIAEIVTVGSGQITIDAGPAADIPAGARVYPLFEAQINLAVSGSVLTDTLIEIQVSAIEEEGDTQFPGTVAVGTNPSGFQTHDGLPILDPSYNFNEEIAWGFVREGQRVSEGVGGVYEVYGSRSLYRVEAPLLALTRAEAFDLIRFFDSRGGRSEAFWLIPPTTDYYNFIGTAMAQTQLLLSCGGVELDWNFRPYVYLKKRDGTIYIREISSVARGSDDTYVVTLDTALPEALGPSNVEKVGVARKARFFDDVLVESWNTDGVMSTSLAITELEEEKEITIEDLTEIETSDLIAEAIKGQCIHPLPAGVYVAAPGKSGSGKDYEFALFDPDEEDWTDFGDLIEEAVSGAASFYRIYYFPEYDPYALFLCGNIKVAGSGSTVPEIVKITADSEGELEAEAVGDLSDFWENQINDTYIEHYPDCLVPYRGKLYFCWTKAKDVNSFAGILEVYRLMGTEWDFHSSYDSGENQLNRVNSIRRLGIDRLPSEIKGSSTYYPGMVFAGQNTSLLALTDASTEWFFFGPGTDIGPLPEDVIPLTRVPFDSNPHAIGKSSVLDAPGQSILVGDYPNADEAGTPPDYRGNIAAYFEYMVTDEGPPVVAEHVYTQGGGGHWRNSESGAGGADPIPLTRPFSSTGRFLSATRYGDWVYTCGSLVDYTQGDAQNLNIAIPVIAIDMSVDFLHPDPEDLLPDSTGGTWGEYDGGHPCIQEMTWKESGPLHLNSSNLIYRSVCWLEDTIYAVGSITDVSGYIGNDAGPDHRVLRPNLSDGPGEEPWVPWVVRPSATGEWWEKWSSCFCCTAVHADSSQFGNWHD